MLTYDDALLGTMSSTELKELREAINDAIRAVIRRKREEKEQQQLHWLRPPTKVVGGTAGGFMPGSAATTRTGSVPGTAAYAAQMAGGGEPVDGSAPALDLEKERDAWLARKARSTLR